MCLQIYPLVSLDSPSPLNIMERDDVWAEAELLQTHTHPLSFFLTSDLNGPFAYFGIGEYDGRLSTSQQLIRPFSLNVVFFGSRDGYVLQHEFVTGVNPKVFPKQFSGRKEIQLVVTHQVLRFHLRYLDVRDSHSVITLTCTIQSAELSISMESDSKTLNTSSLKFQRSGSTYSIDYLFPSL
ncbi:hypothetical protein GEMRC1_012087 [Eukaryota sp. GEM-RC1]